ncbi:PKD domain-containing protein [Pseudoalteromonas sp. MMG005]|uniref:PKD domain-containing protein n=1 Tax=Pseudoalteromonas sp. MMG005 TaxID=2822682 RepID=UPI001B3A017C|nr:PKD domain-containing protein [Pseudoalteromonas sp. MMG005]MBQ4846674.1 PKD domain-containing protein [Pseudoalteromonas sp. MMG005]
MKTTIINLVLATSLISTSFVGHTADLTRGPYLQMAAQKQVTIRWQTDTPVKSQLHYGESLGNLKPLSYSEALSTEHEITVDKLQPDKKYFYAIYDGSTLLSGNDEQTYFRTSPLKDSDKNTRIWILGDPGRAGTDPDTTAQKIVRDGYLKFAGNTPPDFWMMLGDNAYNDGTITEYDNAVFSQYPTILKQSTLWPIMGNHDNRSADVETQTGGFYDLFSIPTNAQSGGVASSHEAYYSFDYGNIHVVVLNSSDKEHYKESSAMLDWLKQDLAANDSEWLISAFHHPVYGKSGHDSDEAENMIFMRERFLPVLEQYGVDLILAGHNHFYTRSVLMADHHKKSGDYNPSTHIMHGGNGQPDKDGAYTKKQGEKGAVFITHGASAGSGKGYARQVRPDEISEGKRHPTDYIYGGRGSIVLDIFANSLKAHVLGPQGDIVDYFTITHRDDDSPANNPPIAVINAPSELALFEPGQFSSEDSLDSDGHIVAYYWQFGDGITSTLANSTHQYSAPGDYIVRLTLTDDKGAQTSTNTHISVSSALTTKLTKNEPITVSGNAKDTIYFYYEVDNTSQPVTISITGTQGDADLYVKYAQRPTKTDYDCKPNKNGSVETCNITELSAGKYFIMLYGHRAFSDVTLLATQTTLNNSNPIADANGPYQTTLGTNVHFSSAGSFDSDQDELSYHWQFGDGVTSTQVSPEHAYIKEGRYNVSLTVQDPHGAQSTDTTFVTVSDDIAQPNNCEQGVEPTHGGRIELAKQYCLATQNSAGQLQYSLYIDEQYLGKNLFINTAHGTGNANIYYQYSSRPNKTNWDARSITDGNNASLKVTNLKTGWHYIHITTEQHFDDVSMQVSID